MAVIVAVIVLPVPGGVNLPVTPLPFTKPPGRVCILRLSALGDATHVLPLIAALRAQWPDSALSWIIGRNERRLLAGVDDIDFIEFDKKAGWPAISRLRRTLRQRRYDLLLHMQMSARSNLISRLVHAPMRLGWNRQRSRDLHGWFCTHRVAHVPFQHQVDGFLEFARALGVPVPARPRWDLPVSSEAVSWVVQQLEGFQWQAGAGERLLVISPCSSRPVRNWRAEHYARAAQFAARDLGMRVLLTGGPTAMEKAMGNAITSQAGVPCLNLMGRDTLEQSKAILQRADLVLTPDSGPAHIASALGTPVLGLYASTWSRRSGPYHSLDLCVDKFPEAARKYRQSQAEDLRWGTRIEDEGVMDLIQPAEVIDKLQRFSHA